MRIKTRKKIKGIKLLRYNGVKVCGLCREDTEVVGGSCMCQIRYQNYKSMKIHPEIPMSRTGWEYLTDQPEDVVIILGELDE